MHVVSNLDELNFFLRRFAPRVTLRMAPDAVEVTSAEGHFRVAAVVTVVENRGHSRVAAIGDDPVASGVRINVFARAATDKHQANGYFETFLQAALQRLPKTSGIIRPVVLVENLGSLDPVLLGRQNEMAIRAIERWGAVAAVIT